MATVWVIDGSKVRTVKGEVTELEGVRYMVNEIAKKDGPEDMFVCDGGEVSAHAYYEPNPDDGPTVVVHYIEPIDIDTIREHGIEAFESAEFIDAEYFNADERE